MRARRADFNVQDGDETGDLNPFWDDRDYVKDLDKVKASVFIAHGFQDDNVRMNHVTQWWEGLKARRLWLMRTGHTDPFEVRRAVWVETLHRWFDHHLHGVANGIDTEEKVTIETAKDVWNDHAEWPIPGNARRRLLPAGHVAGDAGNPGCQPGRHD